MLPHRTHGTGRPFLGTLRLERQGVEVIPETRAGARRHGAQDGPETRSTADRRPTAIFLGLCVLAVPYYMLVNRHQWFYQDDYDLLTSPARSLGDLFEPHNSHLIVPTRILFRINWELFGMRHFEPYQFWSITAHVALAVMIWAVLRRLRVNPWLATATGIVFLTFGRGYDNIVWAFQVGFGGSVTIGYAHLLLADHEGQDRRRDALAVFVGVCAAASSAPGVVMVGVVGLVMLLRRGWKAAALQGGVPMAAYLIWRISVDGDDASSSLGSMLGFMGRAMGHLGVRVAPHPLVAVALVVLVMVGATLLVRRGHPTEVVRTYAVPLSLAVGALVLLTLTAYGRADLHADTTDFADRNRYSHVLLAMSLPLVGVCLQKVVDERPRLLVPVLVVLLSGVPANLRGVALKTDSVATPAVIMAVAQSPLLEEMHPDHRPLRSRTALQRVTVGWLLESHRAGEIPTFDPDEETRELVADILAFDVAPTGAPRRSCREWPAGRSVTIVTGESVDLRGRVGLTGTRGDRELLAQQLSSGQPHRVTPIADDVELVLTPVGATSQLC